METASGVLSEELPGSWSSQSRESSNLPLFRHASANGCKLRCSRPYSSISACRPVECVNDSFKDRQKCLARPDRAFLSEENRVFASRPFIFAVQGQCHAVVGQIHGRRYQVVNRGQMSVTVYPVIDDAEVFQMGIAIAKSAIQRDPG